MEHITFVDYSFYFIIYGVLGWMVEVLYTGIGNKHFTNRGFLYSPFLPIYGFGAVFLIYFLSDFTSNPLLLFILGAILTTGVEYITAVVLENIFHIKWWDYSSYKYNFQGRVCIRNSILFGFLSVIVMKIIHPEVLSFTNSINITTKQTISDIFFIIIIVDLYYTLRKLNNIPVRHIHLLNIKPKNMEKEVKKMYENTISEKFDSIKGNTRLNIILSISIILGIVAILLFNIYIGLLVVIILIIILYAFLKNKSQ